MSSYLGDDRRDSQEIAKSPQQAPKLLLFLFGIFFAIGFIVTYFVFVIPVWNAYQAEKWVKTPCTIAVSRVESHRNDDGGMMYRAEIEFDYTYQEKLYHGDRYSFARGSSSGREGKQSLVDSYPVGAQRECYVNPRNPTESVIDPGIVPEMWFGLIPLVFVVIGLVGMGFTVRSWRKTKSTKLEFPEPGAMWTPESLPWHNQPR